MPRAITHELKLQDVREPLIAFLAESDGLGRKRGPILVQLPPSLSFDASIVTPFFDLVRALYDGLVVCEPRHATWFSPPVTALLDRYRISRVAADPPPVPSATAPAGWPRIAYFRLHGSPRTYWSKYEESYIAVLAMRARSIPGAEEVWCLFDNTASGAAIENAWELRAGLRDNASVTDAAQTIYKIVPRRLWIAAVEAGVFHGSPVDIADGFMHFSTAAQVQETAAKHFGGQADLLLVAVSAEAMRDVLQWEPSRGGDHFPHLYAPLPIHQVLWVRPLPLGPNGRHLFPEDVES
jgi:uncharacterized protein (DUF952 family)